MGVKEKKAKLRIIVSTLLFVVILFGELYTMINFSDKFIIMISLMIIGLIAVYIVIDGIIVITGEKDSRKEEQYNILLKAEKTAYLLQKKHFEEIEEKLIILEDKYRIPSEEIMNAQKGVAKVIISRSKENADAIINSNDQISERLGEIEENNKQTIITLLEEQKKENAELKSKMEAKIQDAILHMKDMELRLGQSISQSSKVIVSAQPEIKEDSMNMETDDNTSEETVFEQEEVETDNMVTDNVETIDVETDNVETPPMPDLSDPNKVMTPEEIAALIANL